MTTPAMAASVPPLSGTYIFYWSGLPFGRMEYSAETTEDGFKSTSTIRTTGLVRLFARHESSTALKGTGTLGAAAERIYESNYFTKKKPRRVYLKYVKGGALAEEEIQPPENPAKRPPVPDKDKTGVADPLTYAMLLRARIADALTSSDKEFDLPLFDGRRLMNTHISVTGDDVLSLDGRDQPVHVITIKRTPLAGFTEKELKEAADEPAVTMYLSRDERMLPVRLSVDVAIGTVSAEYEEKRE